MDGAPMAGVSEALITEDRVPEGELVALTIEADGASIDVIARRTGADLAVWENVCPHAGRRLDYAPGRFLLHAGRLVCAAHGAQFDLRDGRCVDGPGRGGRLTALATAAVPGGWRVRGSGG